MPHRNRCYLEIWSEHFLGTAAKCSTFLDLLTAIDGGRWIPDKWGHFEPIRSLYDVTARDVIVRAWTEQRPPGSGRSANSILFRKREPNALVHVSTWRSQRPCLNAVSIDLAAGPFSRVDGAERLVEIVRAVVDWSDAVYATVCHSLQVHKRSVGGTPLLRLQRLDWLTFFGPPYVEMFGYAHLLNAPCHEVREVQDGILMLATPRPDSPELTTSDEALIELEEYLGANAFAGRGYPHVPCQVPRFNLSDTIVPARPSTGSGRVQ